MALEQSDYLIVICSPRLLESKWCLREIETFIHLHGRDHILAVLIEGEPIESFPELLRFEEQVITDADGTTHTKRVEVEPLAADVRGKDKKEVAKQIKSELLRLVAPILECNYDDLKMRHKEAHQKKVLRISLSISLVCFLFAAVSTTMALTIHKQSDTISKQYNEALITQAKNYASTSKTLLAEEDPLAAMAVARLALPDSISNQTDKPYTPAAEYALNDSLGVYNNGQFSIPVRALEQNSPIDLMLVSPEEYSTSLDEHSITYFTNDKLAYVASNGYCIYDIVNQKETFYPTENSYSYVAGISDGSYLALSGYDELAIYDSEGNVCYNYSWPEQMTCDSSMAFYKSKQLFAFSSTSNVGVDDKSSVYLVDLSTMKLIYTMDIEITQFAQLSFLNEQLICAGRTITQNSDNVLDVSISSTICSLPLSNEKINWSYTKENTYLNEFTSSPDWDTEIIAFSTNDGVEFLDATNGTSINYYNTGSKPVGMAPLTSVGCIYLVTEDGEKIIASSDNLISTTTVETYDTSNGSFKCYFFGYNVDAGFRKNGTSITLYKKAEPEESTLLTTLDRAANKAAFSSAQNKMILCDNDGQIFLYSMENAESTLLSTTEYYNLHLFFTGAKDETCGFITDDSILLFDSITGEQTNTISLTDVFTTLDKEASSTSFDTLKVSEDNNTIAIFANYSEKVFIYDIKQNSATLVEMKDVHATKSEDITFDETLNHYCILSAYPLSNIEKISVKQDKNDSSVPVYALYGYTDCQLLNADLEPVGHAYSYLTFDSTNQQFILSNKTDILAIPYLSYDALIKKTDNQLNNYQLSSQRMNQLGIQITH